MKTMAIAASMARPRSPKASDWSEVTPPISDGGTLRQLSASIFACSVGGGRAGVVAGRLSP